jgi:hypothetical protein
VSRWALPAAGLTGPAEREQVAARLERPCAVSPSYSIQANSRFPLKWKQPMLLDTGRSYLVSEAAVERFRRRGGALANITGSSAHKFPPPLCRRSRLVYFLQSCASMCLLKASTAFANSPRAV